MIIQLTKAILRLIYKILFPVQVTGFDNIPSKGPVIICSNHISWWDPPLLGSIIHRKVYAMAKEELFKYFLFGKIIRYMGAFPVKREVADRRALKEALKVLSEGSVLILFPEGTRSKIGKVQKPLPGRGFIALKSKAPVVPVAIKGPYKLFKPVKVKIGVPMFFNHYSQKDKGKTADEISLKIMRNITEMLGQKYDY